MTIVAIQSFFAPFMIHFASFVLLFASFMLLYASFVVPWATSVIPVPLASFPRTRESRGLAFPFFWMPDRGPA